MRKKLGVSLLLIGALLLFAQISDLSLATLIPEKTQITAQANSDIAIRYDFINDKAPSDSEYVISIADTSNTIIASKTVYVPFKTLYSGIITFKAPPDSGTYSYSLTATSLTNKEQKIITLRVT